MPWTRTLSACALAVLTTLAAVGASACRSGHAATETGTQVQERPRYVATRESISWLAEDLLDAHQVTGVSLALIDGDEVVWAAGFGMADVEHDLPAGPRTVYHVGSLAKPVTTAAIMQAVERGQLRLDQTLAELLPELQLAEQAEQRITLAQLISHQSGLPSDWFIHELSSKPPPWTQLPAELRGLQLAAEPGLHTIYSNLGMSLAGLALARASGKRFETLVSEELLRPAGMRTAYFPGGPEPQPVHVPIYGGPTGLAAIEEAASYRDGQLREDPEFRMVPAGGLRASVLDLAALARLMLAEGRVDGQQLLDPSSVETLLAPQNEQLALDLDHRFGYGWFLDHASMEWAGEVAWHGGRTYYHHARLLMLPEHDLAVAVAANSLSAGSVVETLAVETLTWAAQEKLGLEPPSPAPYLDFVPSPEPLREAFTQVHAGDYATSIGVTEVGPHDQEIWLRGRTGSSRLSLDKGDSGTCEASPGARVHFLERDGVHLMGIERGDRIRPTGVRLEPPKPIPQVWQDRVGRWTLVNRPGEVSTVREPELRIVDGRLRFEYLGQLESPPMFVAMVLEPIDDTHARVLGIGRGQGVIVEIRDEGQGERLWWAGREFRLGVR